MTERVYGVKPIKTVYKGVEFRSMLEARWAVYFDLLGEATERFSWCYEPGGFQLKDGSWYLPDFLCSIEPCHCEYCKLKEGKSAGFKFYCEVKPTPFTEEEENKCVQVSEAIGLIFWMVHGMPSCKFFPIAGQWGGGLSRHSIDKWGTFNCCDAGDGNMNDGDDDELSIKAKNYKFNHGTI